MGLTVEGAVQLALDPCGGLPVVEVRPQPGTEITGTIVGQDPQWRASMTPGDTVVVYVAVPADRACTLEAFHVMPDVVGATAAEAQRLLGQSCFGLVVRFEPVTDLRAAGSVVAQRPAAGDAVAVGAEVVLSIARGG